MTALAFEHVEHEMFRLIVMATKLLLFLRIIISVYTGQVLAIKQT